VKFQFSTMLIIPFPRIQGIQLTTRRVMCEVYKHVGLCDEGSAVSCLLLLFDDHRLGKLPPSISLVHPRHYKHTQILDHLTCTNEHQYRMTTTCQISYLISHNWNYFVMVIVLTMVMMIVMIDGGDDDDDSDGGDDGCVDIFLQTHIICDGDHKDLVCVDYDIDDETVVYKPCFIGR